MPMPQCILNAPEDGNIRAASVIEWDKIDIGLRNMKAAIENMQLSIYKIREAMDKCQTTGP